MEIFKIGMLISSKPSCRHSFMPGVGELVLISEFDPKFICEFKNKIFRFDEDEIYEYDPY